MAFIIKDRVKESTTSTGTGAISLSGASATFEPFSSYMTNGDTTYYAVVHTESGVDEWEVGLGTWNTGNTITRTTVLAGSNGTSAVNFSAGAKDVFMTYPAAHAALAGDDVDFANITVSGTVDGRDVATDGAKLDTVEQNADVTDAINVAAAGALMRSGGTMTGALILNADPTTALGAATKEYVDTIAAAGIHYHTPVRVEAPLNLTVTYNNGTNGVGATLTNAGTQEAITIDGVALSSGDRVLVYEQTDATQNGIYTVTTVGSGSTNWVLTRATDADSYGASDPNALGEGDAYFVKEGATGAGELYVMNTAGTITFGTTAITFTVIAETAVYSAGTGITLTGTTFSIGQDVGTTDNVTFNQVTAAIIGNVTGNVTGDLTGNADTATALATARTVQLSGDVTGSATFDGSDNINITAAVQDDSHAHVISNVDGLQTALNAKVPTSRTITAGNGLTGGGNLTANRTLNVGAGTGITVSADTVSIGQSVGPTDDVTFGTVTAEVFISEGGSFTSGTDTNTTSALVVNKGDQILVDDGNYLRNLIKQNTAGEIEIGQGGTSLITAINLRPGNTGTAEVNGVEIITTAGSGLSKSGDTLSHDDTSSQASVNNSNGTVIQDITLDTYGHITSLASVNLDGRYYTETEADSRFVNVTGDTMTGTLTLSSAGYADQLTVNRSDGDYYSVIKYANSTGELARMGFTNTGVLHYRVGASGTLVNIFHDDYHPNADKWTTARTLSLTGDVTGSVSWDGSGNASLSTDWRGGTANANVNMNNFSITNANHLTFNDPGPTEGVEWLGGNGWRIVESPDDLTTNSGGNLQFVQSSTRRMTLKTNGDLDIVGGNLLVDSNNGITNSGGWTRNTTPYGYIEFGPANASWGHIYTDRPNFYFNKELYVNNSKVWNAGNDGSGSGLDADLLDGNHASAFYLATNPSGYTTNTGTVVENGTTFSGTYPVYFRVAANNAYSHPNITFTGSTNTLNVVNIAPSGTVDGRDVATDGAKLDGIAANANNYSFPYTVSASASNSTVVQRHSSGYIYANYFNTTPNDIATGSITKIVAESGNDGFMRHASADAVRSFINVANGANNYVHPSHPGDDFSIDTGALSGALVISDLDINVTTDTLGHVTDANATVSTRTLTLANLGYTGATNANNYSLPATPSVTGINIGSQVNLAESSDRADLLQITSSTSSWAGLQIRNSSNEGRWSFMTDGATAGFYDDENNDWAVQMAENGGVNLYYNNTLRLNTVSGGVDISGNLYVDGAIIHNGDTDTNTTFGTDTFSVTTGGSTRMLVDNTNTTMYNNIQMSGHYLDMNNNDIYGVDQIFHEGDTNTYMQFHAADQWRVVVGGSERLEVKNASPHVLVTGDLNSTSDERLKDNIKPIENALSDVCRLEGVSFNWKDTGTKATGFIAQQVEPILPDLVNTNEDDGIKSVNYLGLIGHLVEAIKEQQAQIDALTAQING